MPTSASQPHRASELACETPQPPFFPKGRFTRARARPANTRRGPTNSGADAAVSNAVSQQWLGSGMICWENSTAAVQSASTGSPGHRERCGETGGAYRHSRPGTRCRRCRRASWTCSCTRKKKDVTAAFVATDLSDSMGWFGPDEQELPAAGFAECTKWMIVYEGGATWRNSPNFEDRAGEAAACGDELVEAASGTPIDA